MLVAHGIWAAGALHLWVEDSELPARVQKRPPGQPRGPRRHPFAGSLDATRDALSQLAEPGPELALKADAGELTLWLPGTAAMPAPSPELIGTGRLTAAPPRPTAAATADGERKTAVLVPWQLPALAIEPGAAFGLLLALGSPAAAGTASLPAPDPGPEQDPEQDPDRGAAQDPDRGAEHDPGPDPGPDPGAAPDHVIALGGTLPYLAAIARLAADLASRGRVLPGLDSVDGRYAARWMPVLTGPDARRARDLAAAMPPVCRATEAAGTSGAATLMDCLQRLADAAARTALAARPGFELLPGRAGRARRDAAAATVPGRWAAALTGADAAVATPEPADEAEAARLAADLAAWREAAQLPAGPVRTCFRLVEPGAGAGEPGAGEPGADEAGAGEAEQRAPDTAPWTVEFALQSTEDPSLLLPAADIWAGLTAGARAAAGISHPDEDLLAGLGAAARLFPEIELALQEAAPTGAELDIAGALAFLRETGPLLAGAGFGVLLPDWARRARLGLRLTTRSGPGGGASAASPKFGLRDLVDFRSELAVGGQALDPDELAELARLKVPLIRLRGQWVELDQGQLRAALKWLERGPAAMTAQDALTAVLHGTDDDLPLVEVDADGWLGDLLSGHADQRLAPVRTPASFRGELRPYQQRGVAWLSFLGGLGLGAILADDMGLGKSVETLSLLQAERESGTTAGPTLLVCPMSLVGNWQREAERFTPELAVHVHHGADRLTGDELARAVSGADLVITTYGVAARDQQALSAVQWGRVVCDEAQNIKNSATRQARAVRALPAGSRIALTGTPVENRLGDLWSIMEFTSPGLLGPAERFRQRYAVPIERNGDETAAERLKRITGPFILRRLKTDKTIISDLPEKAEMKVWCNLTPEQASLYQATVTDMLAKIEAAEPGIERRGLVLATMAKLKQACNHPAHLLGDGSRLAGRSGKLARLEEICEEIVADGDRGLCFTQYAEFGRMLQPYLAARLGCEVLYLHGGTPKRQRDAMVARFQAETEPALFILSLKAGGTGLNLTAASHVIHVDRWWNPAVEDQATDRAFRIGQRRDVQVRKFVCVGTVEERIDAMIEEKKALAGKIVGTGESWLADMSVADLRDVIALAPEAVSQ